MATLAEVFPTRPIVVRRPRSVLRNILGMVMPLLLLGALVGWIGFGVLPDFINDVAIRGSAEPIAGGRMVTGRCSTRAAIVHDCSVTLAGRGPQGMVQREVTYLFASFDSGSYTVHQILAKDGRPETMTTDIGMDHLVSRAVMILLFGLLGVACAWWFFATLRDQARQRARVRALSGKVLSPVPLELVARGKESWTVRDRAGRSVQWEVPAKAQPFLADAARGLILGVSAAGAEAPMPVDFDLKWLVLQPEERAALMQFRAAAAK